MGERFAGRYELVDHLSEGGTGSVWRAWDARRGQYVAAKLLRQRDAGALLRFVREQSLRVQHPHVVAPTGWAAEDDDVLLTMDLVRGGSVASLLGDYGRLPPAMAGVLVDQLLDALAAVHRVDLVHRDVKPANLLLEPTGTGRPFLRLADFGIAVLRSDPRLTGTGYVVGTAGYVAPEVLRGAQPDPLQDLWSVGTVGLKLLGPGGGPDGGLADWLRTLTREDPARRPPDAGTARGQLHALGALPQSGDDPVEVFDHLPPLPDGWTPSGPVGGPDPSTRPTGSTLRTEGGPVAMAAPQGTAPDLTAPDVTATVTATAATQRQAPTVREPQAGSAAVPVPVPEVPVPAPARRLPVALVLRVLLAVLLVALAVLAFSRARASGSGAVPAPSGLPTTTAGVGERCSWSDVGVARAAGGRQITCRPQGGGYAWTNG